MNWDWVAEKSTGLMSFLVGLGFVGASLLHGRYRYFYLFIALLAILYGFKQLKKHDTPFERHERDLRRRKL